MTKQTNNDLQNITQKTKNWATWTYKTTCDSRRATVKGHEHHLIWKSCWTLAYLIWSDYFLWRFIFQGSTFFVLRK